MDKQAKDGDQKGSWPSEKTDVARLGRVASTAYAALCLDIYYRYRRVGPYADVPAGSEAPAKPAAPTPAVPNAQSGKDAVDYSEYIRKLQEGKTE